MHLQGHFLINPIEWLQTDRLDCPVYMNTKVTGLIGGYG